MKIKELYRYVREDGGVSVTLTEPKTDHTVLSRLIADIGHILTNGSEMTPCVDTESPEGWTEIEDTSEDTDPTQV